jgi:hypothetical protein
LIHRWKSLHRPQQSSLPFAEQELLLRTRSRIAIVGVIVLRCAGDLDCCLVEGSPLQGLMVRYPEEPAVQILARLSLFQVPEQRQEDLLKYVFAIVNGQTKRHSMAKQRVP